MDLPVTPPIAPMLGRLARELPVGGYCYEPKWDGFRCLAFRSGAGVDLRSRNDRPLARYFPELVEALVAIEDDRFVLDGEIVVAADGGSDFAALMARLHPAASRVRRLSAETPASLIAFDLLAAGGEDLRSRPFAGRRRQLAATIGAGGGPIRLSALTDDPDVASRWLEELVGGGIDGVMAKARHLPYREGARAMVKVKKERTLDCVVAGFRWYGAEPIVGALLLGLHDADGELQHIGVASQFRNDRRRELVEELAPLIVPLERHPWRRGFLVGGSPIGRLGGAAGSWRPDEMELDWIPVAPSRVCEVTYDHIDHARLRHPARFRRWRGDREPSSCTLEQLGAAPVPEGGLRIRS
jgi:ATP-dependent DNA ligase